MRSREQLRAQMIENAAEINRLHNLIHETYGSPEQWRRVCEEFHDRYSQLCMPGGWDAQFMPRLMNGDPDAVEATLCFLEVRPYFFRSGYMWKDLLRKCKRVPMNDEQSARFALILKRYDEWKAARAAKSERGARTRSGLEPVLRRFDRVFPVRFEDSDFDGLTTVRDLYNLLCRKLSVEPLASPDRQRGIARKPISPGQKVRNLYLYTLKSEAHKPSSWNGADIWATLIATLRDAYGAAPTLQIDHQTVIGTKPQQ